MSALANDLYHFFVPKQVSKMEIIKVKKKNDKHNTEKILNKKTYVILIIVLIVIKTKFYPFLKYFIATTKFSPAHLSLLQEINISFALDIKTNAKTLKILTAE